MHRANWKKLCSETGLEQIGLFNHVVHGPDGHCWRTHGSHMGKQCSCDVTDHVPHLWSKRFLNLLFDWLFPVAELMEHSTQRQGHGFDSQGRHTLISLNSLHVTCYFGCQMYFKLFIKINILTLWIQSWFQSNSPNSAFAVFDTSWPFHAFPTTKLAFCLRCCTHPITSLPLCGPTNLKIICNLFLILH